MSNLLPELKQFLSSDICLSCEGCCRFDQPKSDWRPKVGRCEEGPIMASLPKENRVDSSKLVEQGGYLKEKVCNGIHACTFFNPDDLTCAIYHQRPFECRLYPFVLTRLKNKEALSVHLPCPYVEKMAQSDKYNEYVLYLKEFFAGQEVLSFLRENPHLFGDYPGYEQELERVFDMHL